jgi:hypothetical protein
VFTSERGAPFTTAGFARMIERAGKVAKLSFKAHPHMLRDACGYAPANRGHDTRALQAYLGHRNLAGVSGKRNTPFSTLTLSAQQIAVLAEAARRTVVGLLLLAPSLGPAFAENLQLFPTEVKARQQCDPSDIVVWLNTATGIYHLKGMRWYGNTASGAFICRKDGDRAGYRLSVFCRYC